LEANTIKQVVTENEEIKCAVVERLIRTIKGKLYRYFSHYGKQRYVHIIQKVIAAYNNSIHSSIGRAPNSVTTRTTKSVWNYLYSGEGRYPKLELKPKNPPKFLIGDTVRVSEAKRHFAKGYSPNFTYEIFKISQVLKRNPIVYKLEDSLGELVTGTWYENELQKVTVDDSTEFKIEQILKTEGKKPNRRYLVKWKGYPAKFNSYVYEKDIVSLQNE
jgi:hypothetical protein